MDKGFRTGKSSHFSTLLGRGAELVLLPTNIVADHQPELIPPPHTSNQCPETALGAMAMTFTSTREEKGRKEATGLEGVRMAVQGGRTMSSPTVALMTR